MSTPKPKDDGSKPTNKAPTRPEQDTKMPSIGEILSSIGSLAIESFVDGKAHPEVELTVYGEMVDISHLEQASESQRMEQWNLPNSEDENCPTKARIRGINDRRWILTTKTRPKTSADGVIEVECDISRDMFNSLRNLCNGGYSKTRYYYPIPNTGLQWEVDVFYGTDGSPHPWVKLDLEVPSLDVELPPWPFPMRRMVVDGGLDMDYQDRVIVDRLWNEDWAKIER